MENFDYSFKVIILGSSGVGKTCILQRYCNDVYDETKQRATLSFDYLTKKFDIDKSKVSLNIWDTVGQERFRNITRSYYNNANGAILVYDTTSMKSFKKLEYWIKDLEENGKNIESKILVGSKIDMIEERQVRQYDGKKYALEHNMEWTECSAKEAIGIDEIFKVLATKIINEYEQNPMSRSTASNRTLLFSVGYNSTYETCRLTSKNHGPKGCC